MYACDQPADVPELEIAKDVVYTRAYSHHTTNSEPWIQRQMFIEL